MPLMKEMHYTYADYLTWDETERTELIDGIPFMMAPPSRVHQEISGELFRQIANYLDGKRCRVYAAPFAVRLFSKTDTPDHAVDTVVEPDLSIVCDREKLDDRGCKGAPDMIVEILSPSSVRNDRLTKFNLYQRAGVREYWIVNPTEKSVQVFVLEGGHYAAVALGNEADILKVNVLDGCYVDLGRVFGEQT